MKAESVGQGFLNAIYSTLNPKETNAPKCIVMKYNDHLTQCET